MEEEGGLGDKVRTFSQNSTLFLYKKDPVYRIVCGPVQRSVYRYSVDVYLFVN
jgi:hypothetical protein